MLCHEVFAPHGQLHALRGINTPSAPPPNTLVSWSPGQRGRGTCLPGAAAVATVTEPAGKADAVQDGNAARNAGGALNQASHEQVVFCHDAPTGLRAIIAIYSTALGPALGGTRFYPYPSTEAAISDV